VFFIVYGLKPLFFICISMFSIVGVFFVVRGWVTVERAGELVVTRLLFEYGIQLIGLPALQVALHQRLFALSTCRTAVSPFRIQHSQQLSMLHRHLLDGRFVSAPEPRLSPYALADVAILHVGRSFLKPSLGSKAAHQLASPNTIMRWTAIKILEPLFCCMFIYGLDG